MGRNTTNLFMARLCSLADEITRSPAFWHRLCRQVKSPSPRSRLGAGPGTPGETAEVASTLRRLVPLAFIDDGPQGEGDKSHDRDTPIRERRYSPGGRRSPRGKKGRARNPFFVRPKGSPALLRSRPGRGRRSPASRSGIPLARKGPPARRPLSRSPSLPEVSRPGEFGPPPPSAASPPVRTPSAEPLQYVDLYVPYRHLLRKEP